MATRLLPLGAAALRLRLPGYALAFPNFIQPLTPLSSGTYFGNTFTLETWVRVNAFTNTSSNVGGETFQTILLGSLSPASTYGLSFLLYPTGIIEFRNYLVSLNEGRYKTGADVFKVGRWFHLAFVHDYDNAVMRFFVNAQQVYQTQITSAMQAVRSWSMGNVDSQRAANNLFGALDEFRLWKVARTAQQIADNYQRPNAALVADGQITPTTMAFCYDFDTAVPNVSPVFLDGSGNGVTANSSATNLASSQIGPCPMLTGYPASTPRKVQTLTTP
jgi:hypothetical protein